MAMAADTRTDGQSRPKHAGNTEETCVEPYSTKVRVGGALVVGGMRDARRGLSSARVRSHHPSLYCCWTCIPPFRTLTMYPDERILASYDDDAGDAPGPGVVAGGCGTRIVATWATDADDAVWVD